MTSKIDDGGTAFPTINGYVDSFGSLKQKSTGLSLRDYFAGQAVVGISEPMMQAGYKDKIPVERQAENIAAAAYFIADKMIAARKEGAE